MAVTHELSGHNQADHRGKERKVLNDDSWIDQNADRDKEECHERVTERKQSGQCFVRIFRRADDKAGQKGSQREGQSDRLRDRRSSQADGERDEKEQFLVLGPGDVRQDVRNHLGAQVAKRH
jgi:hypothetical protein